MTNLTSSHNTPSDIVRITEHENSGVHATTLSRMAIGYILSGTKYIYNNDKCYEVEEGDMFIPDYGFHYEENLIGSNGRFEQIVFYISAATLQQIILKLRFSTARKQFF